MTGKGRKEISNLLRLCSFCESPIEYFKYFRDLLILNDIHCAGDITPAYAGLSAKVLSQIKFNFEALGLKVKVCFLMRDPVDRVWSSARMLCKAKYGANKYSSSDANKAVLDLYTTEPQEAKARYEKIIPKILSVFPEKDVFFEIYENLFTPSANKRFSDFIGLYDINFKNEKISNKGSGAHYSLDSGVEEVLLAHYQQTYQYIFKSIQSPGLNKWRQITK